MLEEIVNVIPKKKLVKDKWYVGRGRNSNVGFWNGEYFLTLGLKFDSYVIKFEGYYAKKDGCFQPFYLIDEGELVESFGKIGWDKHYGKKLLIKRE